MVMKVICAHDILRFFRLLINLSLSFLKWLSLKCCPKTRKEKKRKQMSWASRALICFLCFMVCLLSHSDTMCNKLSDIMMVYKSLNTVLCTATIQFFPDIIKWCEWRLKKYTLKLHCSVKKRTENCVGS